MKSSKWKHLVKPGSLGSAIGWLQLHIFSQRWGERAEPWGDAKGLSPFRLHAKLLSAGTLNSPPWLEEAAISYFNVRQAGLRWDRRDKPYCTVSSAPGLLASATPSELWCHRYTEPRVWRSGSSSQAGLTNVIKLPGFNFQPLPNCLLRSV